MAHGNHQQAGLFFWARPAAQFFFTFYLSFWLPYYQGTILSFPQRPQQRNKGPIDMPLIKFVTSPKPGLIAAAAEKVEMGTEHPISAPIWGCIPPDPHAAPAAPIHAPSTVTPPTIPENPHNVWGVMILIMDPTHF